MSLAKRMIEAGVTFTRRSVSPKTAVSVSAIGSDGSVELEKLDKLLKSLPESMRKKALRRATREVAKMSRDIAISEAPEDTGQLIASIKVKAARRSRSRKWKNWVGTNVTTEEGLFQGDTFYAGFIEFGTDDRTTKSGQYRGRIEPFKFSFLRAGIWLFPEKKRQFYVQVLQRWIKEQGAKGSI